MAEAPPPARAVPGRAPWRRRALLAIGPLLLLLILSTLDRGELFAVFREARPGPLVAAYLIPLPAILLRTLRWRVLLGETARRWRTGELTALYAQSIALGVATPGRLGELARAGLVARRGGGWGSALWGTLLDRLADVSFLALLAAGASALYLAPDAGAAAILWPVALGAAAGTLLLWALGASGAGQRAARRLLARLGAAPAEARLRRLAPGAALACVLLTAASWAVTYAANHLYCIGLGIEIGYLEIAGISAVTSLAASLPISIAGAGTRDALLIALLAPYAVSPARAVALSTLMLSNVLFVGGICALGFLALPRISSATTS
jgi:uncharacterized membrane protein YbhN (UPF0104 family)